MTQAEFNEKIEKEKSFLFYKTVKCPICESSIKCRTIKSGKLRVLGTDIDMRQICSGMDANKYHVFSCNICGYTALERYFTDSMPSIAVKSVKEYLEKNSKGKGEEDPEYISYRQAFARYHAALGCATAKGLGAKASEQAYICLKTAWLLRGEQEELNALGKNEQATALAETENRFLKFAYDQFVKARMTEDYPMCGMDEPTLDYLIAALAYETGDYDAATKTLSNVITSLNASARLKDKARDLKDEIFEKTK